VPETLEIRRIRIRSVLRTVFLLHAVAGILLGLLVAGAWGVVSIFGLQEIVPGFLGSVGTPDSSSILLLLSAIALSLGVLGAFVWSLIILLYNIVAGFSRGIQIEVVPGRAGEGGVPADGE